MNTDDPIADVAPEQAPTTQQPTVSSASGYLGYTLLLILLLIYSRTAWYVVETIIFESFPIIKPYSSLLLLIWFIPILGLLASVIVPSIGGTAVWAAVTGGFAMAPMAAAFYYVIVFGFPADALEYVPSYFKSV
jgi:hypothetical protein